MENQTQDYFTRHAEHYEKTPGENSISTLDLACGTGKLLELAQEELSLKPGQLYGIDLTPAMINEAKNKPKLNGAQLVVGNVENLPYQDSMFDAITTTFSFHHFASDKALAEIKRVLKPGGVLAIADLCPPSWMSAKLFDQLMIKAVKCNVGNYRGQDELSKFLVQNGFQPIYQNRAKGFVKSAVLLTLVKIPV